MKTLVLLFTIFFLQSTFAAERTIKLELLGMHCSMCPVTIQAALDMSDGVESVKVTRKPDHAVIIYDDADTSPAKLVEIVEKAGYEAKILPNLSGEKK